MPDTVRPALKPAATQDGARAAPGPGPAFGDAMAAHARATHAVHWNHPAHHGAHHHAANLAHLSAQHAQALPRRWVEKPAAVIPPVVQQALQRAMDIENVPQSWHDGLQFIVAQESGGRVDTRSRVDTARGLFQLTHASYHMNPNGAASFGNAVEEAQGGIRYIRERYGTAENAASFWRRRFWY